MNGTGSVVNGPHISNGTHMPNGTPVLNGAGQILNGHPIVTGTQLSNGSHLQNGATVANGSPVTNGTPHANGGPMKNGTHLVSPAGMPNGYQRISYQRPPVIQTGIILCGFESSLQESRILKTSQYIPNQQGLSNIRSSIPLQQYQS